MPLRLVVLSALLALAAPLGATVYTLDSTADQFGEDPGTCTLREAIQAASTDSAFGGCPAGTLLDTINLPFFSEFRITRAGTGEDGNATGDFDVSGTGAIIIQGLGAQHTVIDGRGLDRVFDVLPGEIDLFLLDVTVTGGDAGLQSGGAVRMRGDSLVVRRSHLTGNTAQLGGALWAASGDGNIQVWESALTGNLSTNVGGGIYLAADRQLDMVNVTLSGNVAVGQAGAIYFSAGQARLKSVTVSANSARLRGGAQFESGSVRLDNSIFYGNAARDLPGTDADLYCRSATISHGFNTWDRRDCPLQAPQASDNSEDPLLGALTDAGEGVPVHPLLLFSPAIDSGGLLPNDGSDGHCRGTDQRRIERGRCDRGAYEAVYTYTVNRTFDAPDSNPGNGVCLSTLGGCTLRAALQEARLSDRPEAIRIPAGNYLLSVPGRDEDLAATGDLDIRGNDGQGRLLVGAGPGLTVIDAGGVDRVFDSRGGSLTDVPIGLYGMTLTGGDARTQGADAGSGGALHLQVAMPVTLDRVWIDRSTAQADGGGARLLGSTGVPLLMRDVAITRNRAGRDGGGLYLAQGQPFTLVNALVADNRATRNGGGLAASNSQWTELVHGTVTGNHAGGSGGGFSTFSNLVLTGTVVAGNRNGDGQRPDCHLSSGPVVSGGYNLIGATGAGCAISGDTTGNQVDLDAALSVTSLVAGPLPAALPQPDSPLLAAEPQGRCGASDGQLLRRDLHGRTRPPPGWGPACSIGALEAISDLVFANGLDDGYVD